MSSMISLDGPRFGPTKDVAAVVVFLHGLGADGHDLIELAPLFAPTLPGTHFVSPHAPFPCDMAPMGRQWFSLQDRDQRMLAAGVRAAAPMLDVFLDGEIARWRLTPAKIALVGFSQGTMMALHVAPRRDQPIAGVVGFSGALMDPAALATEVMSRPPVLLIHGDADPIVPFAAMAAAEGALKAASIPVETERRPGLPHSIDQPGLVHAVTFLSRQLGMAPAR